MISIRCRSFLFDFAIETVRKIVVRIYTWMNATHNDALINSDRGCIGFCQLPNEWIRDLVQSLMSSFLWACMCVCVCVSLCTQSTPPIIRWVDLFNLQHTTTKAIHVDIYVDFIHFFYRNEPILLWQANIPLLHLSPILIHFQNVFLFITSSIHYQNKTCLA